jgi:hypothetical protein
LTICVTVIARNREIELPSDDQEDRMSLITRNFRQMMLSGVLLLPVTIAGCAVHAGVGYRVYDPYYSDYHVWGPGEQVYYNQWAGESHHDPHRDFRKLNKDDQKAYFNWRHQNHPEAERK